MRRVLIRGVRERLLLYSKWERLSVYVKAPIYGRNTGDQKCPIVIEGYYTRPSRVLSSHTSLARVTLSPTVEHKTNPTANS
jgi:hypothetical protein